MAKKLHVIEQGELALETLCNEYGIESMSENVVNIFFGEFILLNAKWALEFFAIAFLFIFSGVYLWMWTPVRFELKVFQKVLLEYGLYCAFRYIWSNAPDKKAIETAKSFCALANRYPDQFTFYSKEDTSNGTEGNADKRP